MRFGQGAFAGRCVVGLTVSRQPKRFATLRRESGRNELVCSHGSAGGWSSQRGILEGSPALTYNTFSSNRAPRVAGEKWNGT